MSRSFRVLLLVGASIAVAGLAAACGTEHIKVAKSNPNYAGAVLFSQRCSGCHTLSYAATPTACVFYDVIYAHEATPFIAPAIAVGRRAIDGAGMLLNQGELAFELFNGVAPPAGVMRTALMSALGRREG